MRLLALALALVFVACASPADLAREELGSGPCAKQAAKKCEDQLEGSDQLACMKRETFLCEELAKTPDTKQPPP
jgi:hypothetical protein